MAKRVRKRGSFDFRLADGRTVYYPRRSEIPIGRIERQPDGKRVGLIGKTIVTQRCSTDRRAGNQLVRAHLRRRKHAGGSDLSHFTGPRRQRERATPKRRARSVARQSARRRTSAEIEKARIESERERGLIPYGPTESTPIQYLVEGVAQPVTRVWADHVHWLGYESRAIEVPGRGPSSIGNRLYPWHRRPDVVVEYADG